MIVHVLEEFMLEAGLLRGGACGWRSAVFGREILKIVMGMWFGYISWLHTVILLLV
jgi:hypothetical protein